jgi:acetyl esterase/lipase
METLKLADSIATLALTLTIFAHMKLIKIGFKKRQLLAKISSFVYEYAVYILLLKVVFQILSKESNEWIYRLDVVVMLCLWALFLKSVFSRQPVYEETKFLRDSTSGISPSAFSLSFWFRVNNPFWESRNILIQQSSYFESESPDFLLDIHQHPSFPLKCPVLIYINNKFWNSGNKDEKPPLISYLTLKKWVVCSINTRSCPEFSIFEQVVDIKRAIKWIRENIEKFGGDPDFIGLVGTSAGAHLATICTMTQNDPKYQPGFESVDTSISVLISISGFYDIANDWGYDFSLNVKRNVVKSGDHKIIKQYSPIQLLEKSEKLPPVLLIQFILLT